MTATALFFGRVRDRARTGERRIALLAPEPLSAFRARLCGPGEDDLAEALDHPSVRVAVNGVIAARGAAVIVAPGDEVAFMPPFSGG